LLIFVSVLPLLSSSPRRCRHRPLLSS
jgi:hypothetical protein